MRWVVWVVATALVGCAAGCAPRVRTAGPTSPLVLAIHNSAVDQGTSLRTLLESGTSANTVIYRWQNDRVGVKPFQYAMDNGCVAAAKILLAHGAKPRSVNEVGESTLCNATRKDLDLARMLVESGFDPSGDGSQGSPLHVLAEGAPYQDMSGVYSSEADMKRKMEEARRARSKKRIEFAEWLISKGVAVDGLGVNRETPLIVAARFKEDTSFLEFLIKKGADVNAPGMGNPGAPLRAAAASCNRAAVKVLLKAGAVKLPADKRYKRLVDEVGDISALLKRYGAKDAK